MGEAAFQALTGSQVGPQLLLRLYQSAFEIAAREIGYSLPNIAATIFRAFKERADELGEGFLEAILHDATFGDPKQLDIRKFLSKRRRKGGSK